MYEMNREEFRQLIQREPATSVSLYMPTHRAGREVRQDPIRWKNLLKEAETQLRDLDIDEEQVDRLLENFPRFSAEADFWQHSRDGLAIFVDGESAHLYRLPTSFDELVVVADRYHIKPLLDYFQGDGRYFVLAASPKRVRLMEGSKHGLHEVDSAELPDNLVDALNIDEYLSSLQFHSHTVGGTGGADQAIYHGHGGGSDTDKKEELLQYFRRLDDHLQDFFTVERAPLVFAGVEYLFPIFKKANNCQNLIDQPVTGNHDDKSAEQLHGPSWEVVQQQFAVQRKEFCERYGTLAAREQASDDLSTVVHAARTGRIDSLMVVRGKRQWGTVQEEDGSIERSEQNLPDNEDLLDHAAAHTLLADGNVYLVEDDADMPTDQPVAAVFRY